VAMHTHCSAYPAVYIDVARAGCSIRPPPVINPSDAAMN
jgi:hypothetical protein